MVPMLPDPQVPSVPQDPLLDPSVPEVSLPDRKVPMLPDPHVPSVPQVPLLEPSVPEVSLPDLMVPMLSDPQVSSVPQVPLVPEPQVPQVPLVVARKLSHTGVAPVAAKRIANEMEIPNILTL